MLGYADDEIEPHVSAWERLLHPDDLPRAQEVNESVARGARAYEGEFRLRHKDGHYVQVLSRGYPVRREPGGPVVRIVGTHFDLTERRQAEAERARTELLSPPRLRAGRRTPAHRARDARPVRRAADGAEPQHRRAQGRVRRARRDIAPLVDALETIARQTRSRRRPAGLGAAADRARRPRPARGARQLRPGLVEARRHPGRAPHLRASSTSGCRRTPRRRSTASRRKRSPTSRSTRGRNASTSSSSGRPTRSSSSSKTTASASIQTRKRSAERRLRAARHAGAGGARRRHGRDRIDSRQGHDGFSADGDAARARRPTDQPWLSRTAVPRPAGRRPRHGPARAEAAHRRPAGHEGHRRGQRRRDRGPARARAQARRRRHGHLDARDERAGRDANAQAGAAAAWRSSR